MTEIQTAYQKAIRVIEHCQKPTGFYASGLPGGYEATWARDSIITSLGASLVGTKFEIPFRKSLELLAKHQSPLGQIPNAVGTYNIDRRSDVTYNTIDSTLWYIIGHFVYAKAYREKTLLKRYKKSIDRAYLWLKYQDPNEVTLLAQQPTMDWQDAFPHKYGYVISTQALYYSALKMLGADKQANRIKKVVNGEIEKYLSLYDPKRGYYLPWAWKPHDGEREQALWFDAFGNLMAIVTGLATPKIAQNILGYIKKEKIDKPFPCKAIFPPIKPGDREWHSYFSKCAAKTPYYYLNAGIWPFIGGFYVAALVKTKKFTQAKKTLENLALANKLGKNGRWEFLEWLHGISGKPQKESTPYQGWSAGAYLFAYESLKRKRMPFFSF
ncbi:MAG: glycoside hydrolase 100 family protein [Candidatus Nealsonbacteria bacterium]|nr:glycoside hydrolase 100 family protein [Candidatus Nealsonbacteria bacterium]